MRAKSKPVGARTRHEHGRAIRRIGRLIVVGEAHVDLPQRLQQSDPGNRHRDRQKPGTKTPPVAHVDQVRDRAHDAEVGLVGNGAENDAEAERPE